MELGRRIAATAGETGQRGGKMYRIGGATDWRATVGDGSQDTIRKRGRWCSAIGEIYQRTLLVDQLAASLHVGSVVSDELEAACPGWAQPAR